MGRSRKLRKRGLGRYFQKHWVGLCGQLPITLTLPVTKVCDISYLIDELNKNPNP